MAKSPFRVKALYEYSSPHDDDLSFSSDQIITVTEEEDADWYYGEYEDTLGVKHEGLFPRNFVKMYEPETPPRPSRLSRSKKDLESSVLSNEDSEADRSAPSGPPPPQASVGSPPSNETPREEEPIPVATSSSAQTTRSSEIPSPAPPANLATKPAPPFATKPAPPQVIDKPGAGSFRDRINAFNKPAPPVAPMKPSALGSSSNSSFIKKPFVPPPPSKNAYVPPPRDPPPQKVYRREEDPEVVAQSLNNAEILEGEERSGLLQMPGTVEEEEEDAPKPTTLKDRIALLHKQQMEQVARHAEGAQKKEKPKRPPKKRIESQERVLEQGDQADNEQPERTNNGETLRKRSMDIAHDDPWQGARSISKSYKSREATPLASPTTAHPRELLSDANDADQSGAGDTEDAEEVSTGRDDSDEKPRSKPFIVSQKSQQPPAREADVGDEEDIADEEEELEEEEVDPEVKRRMEIRERVAKMSGGMGMAGMFGPAGGMSPMTSKKQASVPNERKTSGNSTSGAADPLTTRAPPVPIVPMPGLQVRSPEQEVDSVEVSKVETESPRSINKGKDPGEVPDVEDLKEEPLPPSRRSTERAAPPPVPQDRSVPPPPGSIREGPFPLPTDRPIPPTRVDSRRAHPNQMLSPSEGSESDDEMSLPPRSLSLQVPASDDSRPSTRDGPPPVPFNAPPSSLPSRPRGPLSRVSDYEPTSPFFESKERSPTLPFASTSTAKRSSKVPPIPGSSPVIPSSPQSRAPPPPPPTSIPTTRVSTGDGKVVPDAPKSRAFEQSDEEITEYEGDYDTDMAPGATRKEALKSHARVSSLDDDSMTDEGTFHHSGLPSLGPPISAAPRAVPPPPPSQPPRNHRQSTDMPRAPPPPPPPSKEPAYGFQDEKPYPYNRVETRQNGPMHQGSNAFEVPETPADEDPDNLYSASPPRHPLPQRPSEGLPQYNQSNSLSTPGRPIPRSSLEVQRTSTSARRSTDAPSSSGEQGYIAAPIDLGPDSQWWAQPNLPPPALQNRRDMIYEIEETSTTRRGGKQAITKKTVYVLYMDYSQTVIVAHFETKDPAVVSLEQRHEPPPPRLRQDQLENAHTRFGSRIGEGANSKKETTVGDGSPQALVADLVSAFPDALPPVGVRAYGALVYANLQNATVQQFDEIRSGDIVTFRNAKLQGHRGPMKSKYAIEVGKPDHVGIVVDWDGTKKKVRAWEQGRESKKVRIESFKLSDMRSGEVKVWRVMARDWVGWEGQS